MEVTDMEQNGFFNKTALVTGGYTGIGKAIAQSFATAGTDVILTGRNREKGSAVAEELKEKYKVRAEFYFCDLCSPNSVESTVRNIKKDFARIDVLVNNAGIYPAAPFLEMEDKDFSHIFDVNVMGVFRMTRAVVNHFMKDQRSGKILSISSVDSWKPTAGITAYAASKAALNSLVKSFAIELAEYGITSNGIAPGWVATEPVLKAGRWKTQISQVLKGRMADPSEIGELAVFLCSDKADYLNGEVVNFSGGLLMN